MCMAYIDGIDENLIASLNSMKALADSQIDPSTYNRVKGSDFYNRISNIPIQNTKEASRNAMMAMMPALMAGYKGSTFAGARESSMPFINALMNANMGVAEQDALNKNEQSKRDITSYALQNIDDVKNPVEMAGILQMAGIDPKNVMPYNFSTKDQITNHKSQLLSAIANGYNGIRSADMADSLHRDQMAQQAELAQQQMALQSSLASMRGSSGSSGSGRMSLTDTEHVRDRYNKIMGEIENASRDSNYQNNPSSFQDFTSKKLAEAELYANVDPHLHNDFYGSVDSNGNVVNNGTRAYWYNYFNPRNQSGAGNNAVLYDRSHSIPSDYQPDNFGT